MSKKSELQELDRKIEAALDKWHEASAATRPYCPKEHCWKLDDAANALRAKRVAFIKAHPEILGKKVRNG